MDTDITGSVNVYEDMAVGDAESMYLKANLVSTMRDIIEQQSLSIAQASSIIGFSQFALSRMLDGHFQDISEAKMLECITKLGHNVQIVIGPELSPQPCQGRVDIVYA